MTRTFTLAVALALLSGCRDPGPANAVNLTIVSDGSVSDEALARTRRLILSVTGTVMRDKTYELEAGIHREERVQLVPSVSTGKLMISARITDDKGNGIASGKNEVELTGAQVAQTITLTTLGAPVVTPPSVIVTRGKTQRFTADRMVTWSVMESQGGSIDENGLYTAPDAPGGPFTIVASSVADPGAKASASARIADYGIELVSGAIGGRGSADGIGSLGRMATPSSVVVDSNNIAYVGEVGECVIRKFDNTTKNLTVFAGRPNECIAFQQQVDGNLSTARLGPVRGLALDENAGVLWVLENNAVRKIVLSTGLVSTLRDSGGTPLGVGGGRGIVVDGSGQTLYVTESNQHAVQQISLTTTPPTVTTLAGTRGIAGAADGMGTGASFRNPNGLTSDGTNLYVADYSNHTIRKIVISNAQVTTIAGTAGMAGSTDGTGTAARLSLPRAVVHRASDNTLFIADEGNGTVRAMVLASGAVNTFAGMPATPVMSPPERPASPGVDNTRGLLARFSSLQALALSPLSNGMLVVDLTTVRQVDFFGNNGVTTLAGNWPQWGYSDGVGEAVRWWYMGSLTGDGETFYQSENGNALVRRLDLATRTVTTIAGSAGVRAATDGVGTAARFGWAEAAALDGNTLWVTDGQNFTIRKIDLPSGQVTTVAGENGMVAYVDATGRNARFIYPAYLVVGGGHLYISEIGQTIRRMDMTTLEVTTVAGVHEQTGSTDDVGTNARFDAVYGMAWEGGMLYVCDANRVRRYDPTSGMVTTLAGNPATTAIADGTGSGAGFGRTSVLVSDGKGRLYVGDQGAIRRVEIATGNVTTVAGVPYRLAAAAGKLPGGINGIGGMAMTRAGDLLYSESVENAQMLLRLPP